MMVMPNEHAFDCFCINSGLISSRFQQKCSKLFYRPVLVIGQLTFSPLVPYVISSFHKSTHSGVGMWKKNNPKVGPISEVISALVSMNH